MEALLKLYEQSYEKLKKRYEQLVLQQLAYSKRAALLEEEMDELQEVMRMLRPYMRAQ